MRSQKAYAIFTIGSEVFDFIYDRSLKCSGLVGGFVNLLWLAPDHIHLYVESDGELSVESMANKIKKYLEDAILSELDAMRWYT